MTTAREFMDSLTGFEELAIQQMTGKSFDRIVDDGEDSLLMRALVAVKYRRDDEKLAAPAAFNRANALSRTDLGNVFGSDDEDEDIDDVVADEPLTESGKDERTPEPLPSTSPESASQPG